MKGGDRHTMHTCKMGGGGGAFPLENEKRGCHLYFPNKISGAIGLHATWKGVGGQACVHGRGERGALPTLEMRKNDAVRENFNLSPIFY